MTKVIVVKRDNVTGEREVMTIRSLLQILSGLFAAPEQVLDNLITNRGVSTVQVDSAEICVENAS